ncbi:MAG: ATP-dependent RecD-like DNA helicase, partial [Lentisphaerae bacterium]
IKADLIIIDEASMIDIELASALFSAIKRGTHLLIVGDVDQLPSVGPGRVLQDLIESQKVPVTRLTIIYRQGEGSLIIQNAHRVNRGKMPIIPPRDSSRTFDFYWIEEEDPERVCALIEEVVCERIPQRFGFDPRRDVQVLTPMNRGAAGTHNLNTRLQTRLNPLDLAAKEARVLDGIVREGDKVMQIINNYDLEVFNGDIGFVVAISPERNTFCVQFDHGQVCYDQDTRDQLRLAYATTIHKSQGSEYPAVVLPVISSHFVMLRRELIYTAMTRAKKLLVMIGSNRALRMAVENFQKKPRYSTLAERLRNNQRIKNTG